MQEEELTGFHTRLSAVCPFLGTRDPPLDIKPDWVDAEQDAPPPVRVKLERPRSFSQLAPVDAKAVIDLCEPSPKKRALGGDAADILGAGEGARGSTDPAPGISVPPCASQINPDLEYELGLLMDDIDLDEDVVATIGDEVRQDPSLIDNLRHIVEGTTTRADDRDASD